MFIAANKRRARQAKVGSPAHVQYEDHILRLQIPPDRGVMTGPGSEDFLAAEIDDVAAAGFIGTPEMLLELLRGEISQDCDGSVSSHG